MTAIAGSPEYSREYQRRRAVGLPTKGLAAAMRDGTLTPAIDTRKLEAAQLLYGRGAPTSLVMAETGLTYAQCSDIRAGME